MLMQDYKNIEVIVVDDNANYPEYRKIVRDELEEHIAENKIVLIQNSKNLEEH
ncbi:MAG: hypothetical protein ACLRUZ_13200 [Faecalimonas sp.]